MNPVDLRDNPRNWRLHPDAQEKALDAIYSEVGDAGAALLNDRKVEDGWPEAEAVPTLIDGHLRKRIKAANGQQIPVIVGQWTPQEEAKILATFDPIGAMAEADRDKLKTLLGDIEDGGELMKQLLARIAEEAGAIPAEAVSLEPETDTDPAAQSTFSCPKCGFRFSTNG